MPTKEIEPTSGNKLAEGAKTYGQLGGVIAAVIMALWPHINPASMMDQGVVDASVTLATREVVDDAEEKIDAKVDKEVSHLKESICDKIEALKSAVMGLKDLTMEKVRSAEREASRLRDEVKDLKGALYDSRATTKDLKKQLHKVEARLISLEQAFDSSGGVGYMMFDGPYPEEEDPPEPP